VYSSSASARSVVCSSAGRPSASRSRSAGGARSRLLGAFFGAADAADAADAAAARARSRCASGAGRFAPTGTSCPTAAAAAAVARREEKDAAGGAAGSGGGGGGEVTGEPAGEAATGEGTGEGTGDSAGEGLSESSAMRARASYIRGAYVRTFY